MILKYTPPITYLNSNVLFPDSLNEVYGYNNHSLICDSYKATLTLGPYQAISIEMVEQMDGFHTIKCIEVNLEILLWGLPSPQIFTWELFLLSLTHLKNVLAPLSLEDSDEPSYGTGLIPYLRRESSGSFYSIEQEKHKSCPSCCHNMKSSTCDSSWLLLPCGVTSLLGAPVDIDQPNASCALLDIIVDNSRSSDTGDDHSVETAAIDFLERFASCDIEIDPQIKETYTELCIMSNDSKKQACTLF